MRRVCPAILVSLLTFGVLAVVRDAVALPRYSAQYGQRCALCHVNPAGGGPRTLYASQMIVPEELSFSRYEPDALERIRPDLTPAVSVGLDLRNLLMYAEGGRGDQVSMQADVHVVVEADENLTAFLTLGDGGAQEYGGIAYVFAVGTSWLYLKLTGTQTVGDPMPVGGFPLPEATMDLVQQWIVEGALDN